jgi:hypothetical protein
LSSNDPAGYPESAETFEPGDIIDSGVRYYDSVKWTTVQKQNRRWPVRERLLCLSQIGGRFYVIGLIRSGRIDEKSEKSGISMSLYGSFVVCFKVIFDLLTETYG